MSVTSKNIIEVLFGLICIFLFSSGCLFCIKVEFLAIIFVMVYVGAIMVLFLFAIMLLNFREQAIEANNSVLFYLVIVSFLALIVLFLALKLQKTRIHAKHKEELIREKSRKFRLCPF